MLRKRDEEKDTARHNKEKHQKEEKMPIILNAIGLAVLAFILGIIGLLLSGRSRKASRALLIIAGFLLIISCLHFVYFMFSFG
ncbi:MAG: hypothetical protein R6U32_04000 [Candidatus Woesearchaeota archaeon]